jgi:hypothetical protein
MRITTFKSNPMAKSMTANAGELNNPKITNYFDALENIATDSSKIDHLADIYKDYSEKNELSTPSSISSDNGYLSRISKSFSEAFTTIDNFVNKMIPRPMGVSAAEAKKNSIKDFDQMLQDIIMLSEKIDSVDKNQFPDSEKLIEYRQELTNMLDELKSRSEYNTLSNRLKHTINQYDTVEIMLQDLAEIKSFDTVNQNKISLDALSTFYQKYTNELEKILGTSTTESTNYRQQYRILLKLQLALQLIIGQDSFNDLTEVTKQSFKENYAWICIEINKLTSLLTKDNNEQHTETNSKTSFKDEL